MYFTGYSILQITSIVEITSISGAYKRDHLRISICRPTSQLHHLFIMPPQIQTSDDELEENPDEVFGSESEELSDVNLDDDDEEIPGDEEDEEDEIDEIDENDDNGIDNDDLGLEDAYLPEDSLTSRPLRGSRPVRETRKRQLTFYDEDDFMESEDEPARPKKVSVKLRIPKRAAASVEPTDEEHEYKPDVLRLTERQRAKLEDDSEKHEDLMFARMDEQLLALNRKTAKKKETAEQMAVRKAENARRRAHYKTKQLEEEKRDTLNKLLKRRATKTREKEVDDSLESKQTLKPRRPTIEHPALFRWVCKPESSVLKMAEYD